MRNKTKLSRFLDKHNIDLVIYRSSVAKGRSKYTCEAANAKFFSDTKVSGTGNTPKNAIRRFVKLARGKSIIAGKHGKVKTIVPQDLVAE